MIGKTVLLALFSASVFCCFAQAGDASRDEARRQEKLGNRLDAAELFRTAALDRAAPPGVAALDLRGAVENYLAVDRPRLAEETLAEAVEAWPDSWRVLRVAAELYAGLPFEVVALDDKFVRREDWAEPVFSAAERDRVVALRLMLRAEPLLLADAAAAPAEKLDFYNQFLDILAARRDGRYAWRLTARTDLAVLPEPEDMYDFWSVPGRAAPVDADGAPLYHRLPASWEAAASDGERLRWLLGKMADAGPGGAEEADWLWARFLLEQFGVQTMTGDAPLSREAALAGKTGPFAVRSLDEDETIARLANGLKRFRLPDGFNHIRILRDIARDGERHRLDAAVALAEIFENRQQYPKALSFWKQAVAVGDRAAEAVARIAGNSGMLEIGPVAPAGKKTVLSYLYRNGDALTLTAHRLDEKLLLRDIRAALKRDGGEFYENYHFRRPEALGRRALEEGGGRYIVEKVDEWGVDLSPPADHYSARARLELPFDKAGCYLIEAALRDGNTSRVVLWIADLALVRKNDGGDCLFFVADARSGLPAAGAELTLLGHSRRRDAGPGARHRESAHAADENGLVAAGRLDGDFAWLAIAQTADGRLAYLGFDQMWAGSRDGDAERAARAFVITDRPVYRPEQEVNFKVWLGKGSYGERFDPEGREVKVTIDDPEGTTVYEKTLVADAFGGVSDSLVLDAAARLGGYRIAVSGDAYGDAYFRLEEYRKPEYEVAVETPDKALILGDTATIAVTAKYYFGAPVTGATVSYRVLRTPFERDWRPPWRWGWLYGSGPGIGPPRRFHQPEVVAEGEGDIGEDGVFRLKFDTAPARELFGDRDHQYDISVEVRDASRRTVVGSGKVVAARKPFAVMAWAERGLSWTGDAAEIRFQALLPLGGGVKASGTATLYRVRYGSDGSFRESEVESLPVATDAAGDGVVRFRPGEAGQYRVAVRLGDAAGNAVEGEASLTVRGDAGEGDFRFPPLEIVADAGEYAVGEKTRLAVNSRRDDAFVLLFVRAERNAGAKPRAVRLANGTHVFELALEAADQPNLFCEALTVFDGKLYREVREVFVPPAKQTLNLELSSDKDRYRPGERAVFNVKATDASGGPVRGQITVAVYDKAVEYISGGGNVGDIRAHFWSWKRHYSPGFANSLSRSPYRVAKPGDRNWEPIGVYGGREADWNDDMEYVNGAVPEADIIVMEDLAAPMLAAAPMAGAPMPRMQRMAFKTEAATAAGSAAPGPEPQVRSEFADTALWLVDLRTDEAGEATFSLAMPENLTAWKARAWVMASGTRVGEGGDEVETAKNIVVRPQAPRFLTQKDSVVLSANLHNYLPRAKLATVELILEGGLLEPLDGAALRREVELAAGGEARVDWPVTALRPGTARVVMKLITDEESDAAEVKLPIVVHGSRRVEPFGGILRPGERDLTLRFTVPDERLAEQSRLELSFSPSIAAQLLDALPYLVEYPYGCTEQTLNRFLPAVMTRRYLDGLGLSLSRAKAADGKRPHDRNPVFDDAELAAMIRRGVEQLAEMQNADGGWGWFSGAGERSWPHTTAVVVHGLAAAEDCGAAIPFAVLDEGVAWLRGYRERQVELLRRHVETDGKEGKSSADDLDAFVHMILVGRGHGEPAMRDFLHRDRLGLSLSGQSMFGLALQRQNDGGRLRVVLDNLRQWLEHDADNGSARLRTPSSGWWLWHNDDIETQAWYLQLLAATDPSGAAAAGVAKYVLQNRKNGGYWRSTRDTAYCIQALIAYAAAAGEDRPDQTVAVYLDGRKVLERRIGPDDILADNRFVLEGLAVEAGDHELRLERSGGGNVYYGGGLDLFSLEDPIARAGLDLTVDRAYYKLVRRDESDVRPDAGGRAVSTAADRYARERLPSPFDVGAEPVELAPGDLVEVELTVVAKNDFEYLVFEDMKAAGCEAVELLSGYSGNALGAYVEYRDQKVALFVRYLPRGTYAFRYRLRAETPGRFSALPAIGGGMYATDLVGSSDEMKVGIAE